MSGTSLVTIFELLFLVGSGLTVLKLLRTRLHRRYRIFTIYLLHRSLCLIWALSFDVRSNTYFYFWVVASPVTWTLYFFVVRELYGLILEKYKGMRTLGRWIMYAGVLVSVTLSVLSFLPRVPQATPQISRIIGYVYAIDRGVTFSLAVFLVATVLLLALYAVAVSRNAVVHTVLYTVFFLSNSLTMLLKSVFGLSLFTAIDTGLMGASSATAFAWFFFLSPKGEEVRMSVPHLAPEQEQRLLSQLDSLNETLLKVGRK